MVLKEDPSELLVIERRGKLCSVRKGMRWDLTSRRNREAAPGQSTCEQWSRPWDTNKLSAAQGIQTGCTQPGLSWGTRGHREAPRGGSALARATGPLPSASHPDRCGARTGWEQSWAASLTCDCDQGGRQGQQQGRVPPWAVWDPLDEGRRWRVLLKSPSCHPLLRGSNLRNVVYTYDLL